MFCSSCGYKLNDDMLFCPRCGKSVVSSPVKQAIVRKPIPYKTFSIRGVICAFLSLCTVLFFPFFNVFTFSVKDSSQLFSVGFRVFSYTIFDGSYSSEPIYYLTLMNIMFIFLVLNFMATILFIFIDRRDLVIASAVSNIIFLVGSYVVYALMVNKVLGSIWDYFSAINDLVRIDEGSQALMCVGLPGAALLISFFASVVLLFFAIAVPNFYNKQEA